LIFVSSRLPSYVNVRHGPNNHYHKRESEPFFLGLLFDSLFGRSSDHVDYGNYGRGYRITGFGYGR
jgi:hypothetical protein